MIPLVDLAWQHDVVGSAVKAGMMRVIERGAFVMGQELSDFEHAYAEFCGVRHALGVGSGTDAIELAVRALDLPTGSSVLVPANTFIATALGVIRAGLNVRLVDVVDQTFLMDPTLVAEAMTSEVSAVIPVHLYGRLADVATIRSVAEGCRIIEDAAQSQGARSADGRSGGLGDIGATSFYPGKNLGAYGDGGAVTSDDDALMSRIRHLRNWGSDRKYHHPIVGFNSRLDTIQAVVLSEKLKHLDAWNAHRRRAAVIYRELLEGDERVSLPEIPDDESHVFHLFVVRVTERDRVLDLLQQGGIGAGVHYPKPMHAHGALSSLGYKRGDFPIAEQLSEEILSLPMFPGITESQQQQVADAVVGALG